MKIKNIPKKYSYYALFSAIVLSILSVVMCIYVYYEPQILKMSLHQNAVTLLFIIVLPFLIVYFLISFLIEWPIGRKNLKQPENIKYIDLKEDKTSFYFYDPKYNFEISNEEIENLKLKALTFDLRKFSKIACPKYSKNTSHVIYEIYMYFKLRNGKKYEMTCSTIMYIRFLKYIKRTVKNLECELINKQGKKLNDMNEEMLIQQDKNCEVSIVFRIIMYPTLFITVILLVCAYVKAYMK